MYQSAFRPGGPQPTDTSSNDAAMIAHDIRAALQGVVGGVAAIERANFPAPLARQVDGIVASSRLLENLVGLVVGDIAERRPDRGEVDLEELLEFLEHRWTGEAQAGGAEFVIETGPGLPAGIHLQHMPLTRLLGNLLSNAIRHSDGGCISLLVERSDAGALVLRIRDSGAGFPANVLDVHNTPRGVDVPQEGATHGLGLHIVRRLAAETGTTVRLANLPGGGSEASLSIPSRLLIDSQEPASGADDNAPVETPGGPAPDLTGLSLLLAEDNPTNQIVAEQMLRALGAEVVVASDGVEALERFEDCHFDMVVVDIEMPRLSGLDVIRRIRARTDERALTPIVALTAYALREHRDRIAEAGANGMISKPITSIEILCRGLAAHRAGGGGAARRATMPDEIDPGVDSAVVVDREIYDALLAAIGLEMTGELLEKVEADIENARAEMAGALDPVDTGPLRSASHILISVAGAVGATRLQASARALNTAAHGDGSADLAEHARDCIARIDSAIGFVRAERAKL